MPVRTFTQLIGSTRDHDKVMALAEFIPLMLAAPCRSSGCDTLSTSLLNLSEMVDAYRAVTRLSLLTSALSREALGELKKKPRGDLLMDRTDQVGHLMHVLYCLFENSAVLAGHGVLPRRLGRLMGCAVTCWFYTLLIEFCQQCYLLLTQKSNTDEEQKRGLVTLLKIGCFFIFSMTCIPKDGPMLLESATGALAPVHNAIRAIAPRHIALSDTVRGSLGFVASVCDFYC